jgi:putative hemolysin
MAVDILLILGLILLNGFFAMSEMAVVTSRKSRLKQMAETNRGARMALSLAERPERFLSAVQIGITLVGVLTGAIGGVAIADDVAVTIATIPSLARYAHPIALGLSVTVITFLTLILGELVPKRLALLNAERIASVVAPPMRLLSAVTRPFIAILAVSTQLVLSLLGVRKSADQSITEDEIRMLVAEGAEQGVIDTNEHNMVSRVLRLGDRRVDSVMTSRTEIVWLDTELDTDANMAILRATPHSRYPVRRGSDREVLGLLEVKSLLDELCERPGALFNRLRPMLYLPESTPALRALELFREDDVPLALVVDEYGEIEGLVTTNDILTAAVGTLAPTAAQATDPDAPIVRRDDGSWLVDGRLGTDDLRELLGVGELPDEEEHDYRSAAGMLIAHFGRIPTAAESFRWRDWQFEVVDLDGARIDKLLIQRVPGVDAPPSD